MKTLLIRGLVASIVLAALVALVMLARTATLRAVPVPEGGLGALALDEGGAVDRLSGAIRVPTFSAAGSADSGPGGWMDFHAFLDDAFPRVHAALEREVVGGSSLLYRWPGTDPRLDPILLSAHMDLLPVSDEGAWTHPPFSGVEQDGFVWGRGALSGRAPLIGILEAVEALLGEGSAPRRTVLLAFGHDREAGGEEGAQQIASLLEERGVRAAWALSEGGSVSFGGVPGLSDPIGVLGTAEKAEMTVFIQAPDPHVLALAVGRLEEGFPLLQVRGPTRDFFHTLAPHMDPGTRMLVANLWLLERPVARALSHSPTVREALGTTVHPASGWGGADSSAEDGRRRILVRVAPWDEPEQVLDRLTELVADLGVRVELSDSEEWPTALPAISSSRSEGFGIVRRSIHASFPDVVAVAPALSLAPTDGRHYLGVVRDLYRFVPVRTTPDSGEDAGGVDERIRVSGYLDMVRFYAELIRLGTE